MKIVGLIPIYKPTEKEVENIGKYVQSLDYCILLDDSGFSNLSIFENLISKLSGKLKYYLNEHNLGLCASVNNGYEMASKEGADWILIMNPDGTFQNNAIDIFRNYIDRNDISKVAIIAPRFNIDRRKKVAGSGSKQIKYADMTGCLYNVDIFNKIGFYDINTYFYGLDVEMCLRVNKLGYKVIECSEAVLNHQPAETYCVKLFGKTVLKCGRDIPQRYYYQFRSACYINKHYHNFRNFAFHVYKCLKVVFFFDNKKEYFKMIKLGIEDAKKGFYGNINDRGERRQ